MNNIFQKEAVDVLENKSGKESLAIDYQMPEEGQDWNTYFQYTAHKNLLKELHYD